MCRVSKLVTQVKIVKYSEERVEKESYKQVNTTTPTVQKMTKQKLNILQYKLQEF